MNHSFWIFFSVLCEILPLLTTLIWGADSVQENPWFWGRTVSKKDIDVGDERFLRKTLMYGTDTLWGIQRERSSRTRRSMASMKCMDLKRTAYMELTNGSEVQLSRGIWSVHIWLIVCYTCGRDKYSNLDDECWHNGTNG